MTLKNMGIANITQCIESFMEKRRPPEYTDDESDLMYNINGWNILISEFKHLPWFLGKIKKDVVKITYDSRHKHWNLYYQADKRWIPHPDSPATTFPDAISIIEDDINGLFFDKWHTP
ncbi:TPA: DUF3024 domain-containing protein [Morganella morganii]